jgi:hypothetical protein
MTPAGAKEIGARELPTPKRRADTPRSQIAYVHNAGGQPRPGELDHALTSLTRLLARIENTADTLVKKRL